MKVDLIVTLGGDGTVLWVRLPLPPTLPLGMKLLSGHVYVKGSITFSSGI